MLKKMLGKKKEESSSSSSESDNEGDFSEPRKQKKSSLANLKSKFDGSPKEGKGNGITTVKVRSRTGSSGSEEGRRLTIGGPDLTNKR